MRRKEQRGLELYLGPRILATVAVCRGGGGDWATVSRILKRTFPACSYVIAPWDSHLLQSCSLLVQVSQQPVPTMARQNLVLTCCHGGVPSSVQGDIQV